MKVLKTPIALVLAALISAPVFVLLLGYRFAAGARGLAVGDTLPLAELVTPNGRKVNTGSWQGKPTLLVLFQSTCQACKLEIHSLNEIAPDFSHVRFVLLSLDGAEPDFNVPFEVLLDTSGEFVKKTRRLVVPALYWIHSDGRVMYSRAGLRSSAEDRALCNRFFHAGNQ